MEKDVSQIGGFIQTTEIRSPIFTEILCLLNRFYSIPSHQIAFVTETLNLNIELLLIENFP